MHYRVWIVGLLFTGLTASAAAAPCTLQPQYLFFFAANQVNPTALEPHQVTQQNRGQLLIDAITDGWKANPGPLVITGHSDEAEARTVPHLDAARADAMRAALVRMGVDPSAITVQADGFNHPMVPAIGSEAQNRYVTIVVPEAGVGCASTPRLAR